MVLNFHLLGYGKNQILTSFPSVRILWYQIFTPYFEVRIYYSIKYSPIPWGKNIVKLSNVLSPFHGIRMLKY